VREPGSFVIRIYRKRGGTMVGTVQEVRTGRTIPFRTKDELWDSIGRAASVSVPSLAQHEPGLPPGEPSTETSTLGGKDDENEH
jgi:hypothetical protein